MNYKQLGIVTSIFLVGSVAMATTPSQKTNKPTNKPQPNKTAVKQGKGGFGKMMANFHLPGLTKEETGRFFQANRQLSPQLKFAFFSGVNNALSLPAESRKKMSDSQLIGAMKSEPKNNTRVNPPGKAKPFNPKDIDAALSKMSASDKKLTMKYLRAAPQRIAKHQPGKNAGPIRPPMGAKLGLKPPTGSKTK